MMPVVKVRSTIKGSAREAYERAKDVSSFESWLPDVESIRFLEKTPSGAVTEWATVVQGRIFRWVQQEKYNDEKMVICYEQTRGDLKSMTGDWTFEKVPEGVRVTITCTFDIGIPMLAALLDPVVEGALRRNLEAILEALKAPHK